MEKKVLLSTDIGSDIDDAFSLLTILHNSIDLRGIYVVNGDINARAYITKHMIDLSENKFWRFLQRWTPNLADKLKGFRTKSIDVVAGDSQPIGGVVSPYSFCEDCYIDDEYIDEEKSEGKKDIEFKDLNKVGIKTNGLDDLVEKLSNGKYTLFSIAPMTTIARLVLEHPNEAANIEHLYIMGCRFSDELANEHNIRFDVPAAHIVFSSDIPITVIPANLCDRYQMPVELLDGMKSPVGLYVQRMAKGFMAAKTAHQLANEQILDLIERYIFPEYSPQFNEENRGRINEKRINLEVYVVNLNDSLYGAFEPEKYFEQYKVLIDHLRDPELNYHRGNLAARILEDAIPKTLSVSDVYVPYCFLHQDKLVVRRGSIVVGGEGVSRIDEGTKHQIVTDMDYKHFEDFLKRSLY